MTRCTSQRVKVALLKNPNLPLDLFEKIRKYARNKRMTSAVWSSRHITRTEIDQELEKKHPYIVVGLAANPNVTIKDIEDVLVHIPACWENILMRNESLPEEVSSKIISQTLDDNKQDSYYQKLYADAILNRTDLSEQNILLLIKLFNSRLQYHDRMRRLVQMPNFTVNAAMALLTGGVLMNSKSERKMLRKSFLRHAKSAPWYTKELLENVEAAVAMA
jgi:hypothetical protein